MDTPRINNEVKQLRKDIRPYVSKNSGDTGMRIPLEKICMYIPGIILILLLLTRPGFLYDQDVNKKKFSWKKLFVYCIIFSLLCCLGIYGYNYKLK